MVFRLVYPEVMRDQDLFRNPICPAPCRPTAIQVATVFEQPFLGG